MAGRPCVSHLQDYTLVALARQTVNLSYEERTEPPRVPLTDLCDIVDSMNTVCDHAMEVCQLKLGLRAGELCTLQIQALTVDDPELSRHDPAIGTHDRLDGHQNAIHAPHDREGNKSRRS